MRFFWFVQILIFLGEHCSTSSWTLACIPGTHHLKQTARGTFHAFSSFLMVILVSKDFACSPSSFPLSRNSTVRTFQHGNVSSIWPANRSGVCRWIDSSFPCSFLSWVSCWPRWKIGVGKNLLGFPWWLQGVGEAAVFNMNQLQQSLFSLALLVEIVLKVSSAYVNCFCFAGSWALLSEVKHQTEKKAENEEPMEFLTTGVQ